MQFVYHRVQQRLPASEIDTIISRQVSPTWIRMEFYLEPLLRQDHGNYANYAATSCISQAAESVITRTSTSCDINTSCRNLNAHESQQNLWSKASDEFNVASFMGYSSPFSNAHHCTHC